MQTSLKLLCSIGFVFILSFAIAQAQENFTWTQTTSPGSQANPIRFFGINSGVIYLQTINEGITRTPPILQLDPPWLTIVASAELGNSVAQGFALTADFRELVLTNDGIWISDANKNFGQLAGLIGENPASNDVRDMVILDNTTWIVATGNGVFQSTDQGVNWSLILDIQNTQRIRLLNDGSVLVAAARVSFAGEVSQATDLWRSNAELTEWTNDLYADAESFTIRDLEITADGRWIAAPQSPNSTITMTADGGDNWTYTNFNDVSTEIIVLDDGSILAAGANSGVALSTDAGETWPRFNQGLLDNRIIFMGIGVGSLAYCVDVFSNLYVSSRPFNTTTNVSNAAALAGGSLNIRCLSEAQTLRINTGAAHELSGKLTLEIFDLRGVRLKHLQLTSGSGFIDVSLKDLNAGTFLARVSAATYSMSILCVK